MRERFFEIEAIDQTGLQLADYREIRSEKWSNRVALGYRAKVFQATYCPVAECEKFTY